MKPLVLAAALMPISLWAQDTLRHFDPQVNTPIVNAFPTDGFYTGHNTYGDEEFGEKYLISGSGQLLGLIAIHGGTDGNSTMNAAYRVYQVANTGLPGAQIGSKSVSYSSIPVDGTNHFVAFDNPISVTDSFFVTLDLGDYTHNNPGTKRIAVAHSTDGTRPWSDFMVYGRNVVRWHSHGSTPVWKDYRTENFAPNSGLAPAVYFALFPIVQMGSASTVQFPGQFELGSAFPNPVHGNYVFLPIHMKQNGEVKLQLFNMEGKLLAQQSQTLTGGSHNLPFDRAAIPQGTYILLMELPGGQIAQQLVFH